MPEGGSTWVDDTKWANRWTADEEIKGGGQGSAFRARRKDDGQLGFLKVIKSKSDAERRARFFREASAYDAFGVDGVPRLIESNTHHHANSAYIPFIVTEFIEGPTLTVWRSQQHTIKFDTAVAQTRRLTEILDSCHDAGCVHRDVKPDNMIVRDNDPLSVWLLDFGLSYHHMPEIDFRTEDGQEVGNRFLRLPELSAGSRLKQDPRSDVSFAAGILFYLLTGDHPDLLHDAEGKLPHQRSAALSRLQTVAGERLQRLATIFDYSFAQRLEDRFTDVSVLRDHLDRLMQNLVPPASLDDDIRDLIGIFDTPTQRRRGHVNKEISDGLAAVQRVYGALLAKIGASLTLSQTNMNVGTEKGENTLLLRQRGSHDYLLSITYEIQAVGNELVLRMSGTDLYRTTLEGPDWGDEFANVVSRWIAAQIKAAADPNSLPPESSHFKEQMPLTTLRLAAVEADRTNRKILAFVYDPTQDARGSLGYALGAFLRNRKTRDRMNAAFVTALVPLSQLNEVSDILNDASMETSRWVVLDSGLNALEEAVIYANAEVAERQMGELSNKHKI